MGSEGFEPITCLVKSQLCYSVKHYDPTKSQYQKRSQEPRTESREARASHPTYDLWSGRPPHDILCRKRSEDRHVQLFIRARVHRVRSAPGARLKRYFGRSGCPYVQRRLQYTQYHGCPGCPGGLIIPGTSQKTQVVIQRICGGAKHHH